jgi:hypothetical protein
VSTDPDAPQDPATGAAAGEPAAPGPGGGPGPAGPGAQPSEEELRAAYEAELARITSTDMILQAAVSLLNVGSYRLMPAPAGAQAGAPPGSGRDLEQVRDAIDGVRALLEILERRVPSEVRPLRDALSQLQMAYAREVQASGASGAEAAPSGAEPGQGGGQAPPAGGAPGSSGGAPGAPGGPTPGQGPGQGPAPGDQGEPGPGPAESSGRLWVPGR